MHKRLDFNPSMHKRLDIYPSMQPNPHTPPDLHPSADPSRHGHRQQDAGCRAAIERPLLSPYDIINPMQIVSFLWGGDVI